MQYHTRCNHTITLNWNLNQINFFRLQKLKMPVFEIRPDVIHTSLQTSVPKYCAME